MTEEHLGKVVDGRYRLNRLLGEGAAGAVYAATQLSVDRTVAVKILHAADSPTFAKRFQEEARAIGKLNHTNIITLHDFGFDDDLGAHFMVTEYAEGVPLSERMKEVMSTELILKVALEVASAMHHAHAQGILHRDLKPENVILTRADGRVDVAKVLDFGLVELYEPRENDEEETEEAPEPRSDEPVATSPPLTGAKPKIDLAGAVKGFATTSENGSETEDQGGEELEESAYMYGDDVDDDEPATAILPPVDLSADSRPNSERANRGEEE